MELFTTPVPTTTVGKIREFGDVEKLFGEAITDLSTGSPPANAKADNEAMLTEYRMSVREFKGAIVDLRAGRFAAAQRLIAAYKASPQTAVYGRAVKNLEAKGYKYHYIAQKKS